MTVVYVKQETTHSPSEDHDDVGPLGEVNVTVLQGEMGLCPPEQPSDGSDNAGSSPIPVDPRESSPGLLTGHEALDEGLGQRATVDSGVSDQAGSVPNNGEAVIPRDTMEVSADKVVTPPGTPVPPQVAQNTRPTPLAGSLGSHTVFSPDLQWSLWRPGTHWGIGATWGPPQRTGTAYRPSVQSF